MRGWNAEANAAGVRFAPGAMHGCATVLLEAAASSMPAPFFTPSGRAPAAVQNPLANMPVAAELTLYPD